MDKNEFKAGTKALAVNVAKFCKTLPYDAIVKHYVDQIVRSSASVGLITGRPAEANPKQTLLTR